jgi:hypothetical protein
MAGTMGPFPGRNLFVGTIGVPVRQIQQCVRNVPVNGIFTPITREAVVSFQRANGLTADGVVGPLTWARMQQNCGTINPAQAEEGNVRTDIAPYMLAFLLMRDK